ncbi:hypothetical protein BC829DRAFT_389924 [Chytridium lagenaria]|nr:hypothetical protein BC829DRAFT_389924 [Chytridium lagenaria]
MWRMTDDDEGLETVERAIMEDCTALHEALNYIPAESCCLFPGVTCSTKLEKIVGLELMGRNLLGSFPEWIIQFKSLKVLNLSDNRFSNSSVPDTIGSLEGLEEFACSNCSLTGQIPASLGALKGLKTLQLERNNFTGHLPLSFDGLTNLQSLYLHQNNLSGNLSSIAGLSSLKDLSISSNRFFGSIPDHLTSVPKLDLTLNCFSTIPANLTQKQNQK